MIEKIKNIINKILEWLDIGVDWGLFLVRGTVWVLTHPLIFSFIVINVIVSFFQLSTTIFFVGAAIYVCITLTQILTTLIESKNQMIITNRNIVKLYQFLGKMNSSLNSLKMRERKK